MLEANNAPGGQSRGFRTMFAPGRLSLGVFFPIEAFAGDTPTMRDQERLARRAEELGFAALWVRDVPLRDPTFGDIGQIYDPWVYLGWIAAQTRDIALATGSIVLPLRHPLHTAKAAASVDQLTQGRLVLGVASGDRPVEFPSFGVDFERRGSLFRENFRVIREVLADEFPVVRSSYGALSGTADLVPKPTGPLPMLVTGFSRQSLEWIAAHSDGWITYPRSLEQQAELAALACRRLGRGAGRVQTLRAVLVCQPDRRPGRITRADPPGLPRRPELSLPLPRRPPSGRGTPRRAQLQVRPPERGRESRGDRPGDPAPHRSHPTDRRGRDARTVEEPGEPADAE